MNVTNVTNVMNVTNVTDKLFFYSKSADKQPGRGANECVKDASQYFELSKLKNWRKTLSNFHVSPFVFEGKTYNSIEHAFQAKKIALADPEKAFTFTVESGTELGLGDGLMAQKNRKLVKLNEKQIARWFTISTTVMRDAAIAKYAASVASAASAEARTVLRLTNDAELWHIVSRKPPIRFHHLEEIRSTL